jgi:hypothetical protein
MSEEKLGWNIEPNETLLTKVFCQTIYGPGEYVEIFNFDGSRIASMSAEGVITSYVDNPAEIILDYLSCDRFKEVKEKNPYNFGMIEFVFLLFRAYFLKSEEWKRTPLI